MFSKNDENGYIEALEGVTRKTRVHGENTLMSEFKIEKGAVIPTHSHPHEQTGFLVSGKLDFVIGGERFLTEAGDSWCIPGNLEHRAEALEDSFVVEVFSPVREEFLP